MSLSRTEAEGDEALAQEHDAIENTSEIDPLIISQDGTDDVEFNSDCHGARSLLDTKSPSVLLDQERYLPIANVVRIMKTQMDPQAKLAKDAKECVQECVSEFISFIASEAAELCHNTKRKTITADDLLTALEATGFDNYAEPMRIFLMKYRQAHKITGPIHRPHLNYSRPKQFLSDIPIRPLFFDTEQGRRCTETQYVVNGTEVVKNAPLADEWNEQTGTLNVRSNAEKLVYENVDIVEESSHDGITNSRDRLPAKIVHSAKEAVPGLPVGAIALEQQQQMQIYIDPTSKQHYAAMETVNGMELYPIMIQDTPLHLESVPNPNRFLVHLSDGTTGTVASTSGVSDFSTGKQTSPGKDGSKPSQVVRKRPPPKCLENVEKLSAGQRRNGQAPTKRLPPKRKH